MKGDRLSQRATQALQPFRHLGTPVEDDAVAVARRDDLVPLIGNRIRAVSVQRARWRRGRTALAITAVAAGLALAVTQGYRSLTNEDRSSASGQPEIGVVLSSRGAVSLVRQGRPVEGSVEPRKLLAGDRIVTPTDASASLVLLGGARVEADPSTRITLVRAEPPEQRLRLEAGKVEIEVPKLAPGHAFVIEAPETEVRVRGTRFSVEVSGSGAGARTRVGVTRGSVLVRTARDERVLSGGDTWSSPLAAALPSEPARRGSITNDSVRVTEDRSQSQPASNTGAPAAFAEAEARSAAPEATPSTKPRPRASGEVASRGESLPRTSDTRAPAASGPAGAPRARALGVSDALAKQNGLMQAALAARRSGDHGEAVKLLEELLRNHPGSPLTETARVERFRSLRRLGRHAEATREARRYLASHGRGFARDEARGMVLGSETASGSTPKR